MPVPQKKINNLKISIILPNYNSLKYIDATIKSVINQSFKNWELIIIDDCSDEKTKKILSKYLKNKKIKIIWLKRNRGAGYCRNLAIKKSKSKYLAFIDSDDLWEKNKLKIQLEYMVKNNYSFTYTNYKTIDDNNKIIGDIIAPFKFSFNSFIKNTSIGTSTMMVQRKITKNINFTNTEICEDYFYKCKILKKINYAHSLRKFLTRYRIRKESLQSNKFKNIYWIWKINNDYNKLSFVKNFYSLLCISINSIKKYGFK
tara:strand:+ start:147 stop:920 length:774 start_codon:yes stop_codon:yes gene_type:complete